VRYKREIRDKIKSSSNNYQFVISLSKQNSYVGCSRLPYIQPSNDSVDPGKRDDGWDELRWDMVDDGKWDEK